MPKPLDLIGLLLGLAFARHFATKLLKRIPLALAALESYGANAKPLIPYLQDHVKYWESEEGRQARGNQSKATLDKIKATIAKIKASKEKPELMSIRKYLKNADFPPKNGR